MLDILIRGGQVVDGSGAPWFYASVGVVGDNIVFLGAGEEPEAHTVIDARGKIVCPGFIDIHSHADTVVLRAPERLPKITQGVTTEVFSNCGGGVAPVTEDGRQAMLEYNRKRLLAIGFDWYRVSEYLERIPPTGTNVAYLIPHGTLRTSAMAYAARHSVPEEIVKMRALAREGMQDGAFGLSTGLAYVPMSACQTEEVIELSHVIAEEGGILADHMRNYREKIATSMSETFRIARETGVPVQISHYQAYGVMNWGRGPELSRWIDEARQDGLDITFDSYPYDFSAGSLRNTIPAKYHGMGREGLVQNLKDPAVRDALRTEIGSVTTYDLSRLTVVGVTDPRLSWMVGKSLPEGAEMAGKDLVDLLCDLLVQDPGILHVNSQGNASDVKHLALSPYQMVGSDSSDVVSGESKPHPRLWGTFARFLRLYVREEPVLSLEQAVYKMTGFPAWRLNLCRRGLIRQGFAADLVVFDPATVSDTATMLSPEEPSTGIEWVIVNGVVEVKDSKPTGSLGGRVLKKHRI